MSQGGVPYVIIVFIKSKKMSFIAGHYLSRQMVFKIFIFKIFENYIFLLTTRSFSCCITKIADKSGSHMIKDCECPAPIRGGLIRRSYTDKRVL